jgi:membrane associated rhomboid family serine protease
MMPERQGGGCRVGRGGVMLAAPARVRRSGSQFARERGRRPTSATQPPAMFPISDDNPRIRFPAVTVALLAVTAAVWLIIQGGGFDALRLASSVCDYGMVPGELTHQAALGSGVPIGPGVACVVDAQPINRLTPLTSMFLHGSWAHIIGNSLFLWVFGDNVEESMGRGRFLIFYLVCGLAAAAVHVLTQPGSPVPTVGASGAISGVMGAYLVLYPHARVNMLFIFIIIFRVIPVPAWLVLIWWFAVQVITGLPELMRLNPEVSGGVAVWAHVGGFVAGALLVKLFENRRLVAERVALRHSRWPGGRPPARPLW